MKLYKGNSEMAKQIDKYFNINEVRDNLNKMGKEDRAYYLNMILTTLTVSCTETPEEAIGTLDLIKNGLMKILIK